MRSLILTLAMSVSFGSLAEDSVPGEFIVKLKPQMQVMDAQSGSQMAWKLGGVFKKVVSYQANTILVKRPAVEKPSFALNSIQENPNVEYVVPNYYRYLDATSNDPMYAKLWGLSNPLRNGIDIEAERAWDVTQGSKNVVVAVIDTGIDYTHPDLADNIWVNEAEANGQPGVDDDGNGYVDDVHGYDFVNSDSDPMDTWGHGTHCAGTIGAIGGNNVGVVGVNWNVSLMAVQIFTPEKGAATDSEIIAAVDYAVANGAHVLSNSWGGTQASSALKDAFARAEQAGVVVVAAAGNGDMYGRPINNDRHPHYPSNYEFENLISVAAIQRDGDMASFSNYGKTSVDIAAPGVDILSTVPVNSGTYASYSGTSMATPHIAGVAALMISTGNFSSAVELKEVMLNSSVPLNSLQGKVVSGGLVSAKRAIMHMTW